MDANSQPTLRPQEEQKVRPCLIVILQPELTLAKDLRWPLKGFYVNEKEYRDAAFGNWTGFYDWLRDSESNILGVRYTPFGETEFLAREIAGLPYVRSGPSHHLEIYFSERRGFDERLSCDQDFLYDAIFCSEDGEYAIGFGMEGLDRSSLHSLERTGTKWAVARPFE